MVCGSHNRLEKARSVLINSQNTSKVREKPLGVFFQGLNDEFETEKNRPPPVSSMLHMVIISVFMNNYTFRKS